MLLTSGFNRQRPEFQRMLDQIRPGDTTVIWKLDRLARSTRDLLNTMETISEAGGDFQSLSEPWENTTTHAGIKTKISCHSFRATGITTYLQNGGKLEIAQQMAGHESARTTGLYDRRNDSVALDEVERIAY